MSFESPISVLQNLAGDEVAVVTGSALNSDQPGVAILAKDESGNAQFLNVNASGKLKVDADVNVTLNHADDSVQVYGSEGVLAQDSERSNSLKTYDAYVSGALNNMGSSLGGKLDTLDSSVGDVETAVDGAKSAITGSISTMDSNLGGKLDTLDTSVGAVETAVDNAKSAITGSISTMDSNLGGKLDTLDSSVGDVETAVDNAKSAITGSISTMDSNLGGKLDTLDTSVGDVETAVDNANAVDFATETTLDAFKSANHSDLVALSSSLDRFGFDAGALIVTGNLNVEVGLTQQDEVTVYQGTNPWIVNDSTVSGALNALGSDLNAFASANHSDLLAIDGSVGDVETAVDNAKSAITGSISTMDSNLGGKLDTLDTSVGDVETAVDNA
ncbi:MAG: hypothetical protein EB023_14295, partial [Flavobacteriia bacterium]|nr:hypothetical protein [Flavobacteriia bacterium]